MGAKDDTIVQFGIEYVALIYNKDLVKPQDAPKSYKELADPKWRDKIVMPDPATHAPPSAGSWASRKRRSSRPRPSDGFPEGLAANKPMFVLLQPDAAPVESGQKLIAVSMPKYIITHAPAPLDWASDGSALGFRPRDRHRRQGAAPERGPGLHGLLSLEGRHEAPGGQGREYVLAPGVYPPIPGIDKARVLPIRELSDEEIASWGAKFKTIFAAK
jgi:iron(III) transport system substrate-binding protein